MQQSLVSKQEPVMVNPSLEGDPSVLDLECKWLQWPKSVITGSPLPTSVV